MDKRMTQESYDYVVETLRVGLKFLAGPPNPLERMEAWYEFKNKAFQLDCVRETEYFIPTKFDAHKIPITVFRNVETHQSVAFFYYHSGGFRLYSAKTSRALLQILTVILNCSIVAVDFRHTPTYKHDVLKRDSVEAARAVLANKHAYELSTCSTFGVLGDSAGGNLAAFVALELASLLKFQILIYPWLDLTVSSKYVHEFGTFTYILDKLQMTKWATDAVNDTADRWSPTVSPVFLSAPIVAPRCLLVCGELDPLFGDSVAYHELLKKSNVECEFKILPGCVHGFFAAYNGYANAFHQNLVYLKRFIDMFQ